MENHGYIYKITSPKNKCYIGQTINKVEDRWQTHIRDSMKGIKRCRAIAAAIAKYKIDNMVFEVIKTCPIDELNQWECYYIKEYNSMFPTGYNLREGGNGKMTEESKKAMIKGNNKKLIKKKRYVQEQVLPKYIYYHNEMNKNGTKLEGYKVTDHPKGTAKSFLNSKLTMEQKLANAIAYVAELDASAEFKDNSKKTPKHVSKYGVEGFQVNKPGNPRKFFAGKTREENLQNAIRYLNTLN